MPDKEEKPEASGEVTLKLPFKLTPRLVLFVLVLLTGSGTVWNRLEQWGLVEKQKVEAKVDAAVYDALVDKLNGVLVRLAVAEVRVERLERDARRSNRATVSSAPATAHAPEEPPPPAPPAEPMPDYASIRAQAQQRIAAE